MWNVRKFLTWHYEKRQYLAWRIPWKNHFAAAQIACSENVQEPFWGKLSHEHLQLCPQNFGHLSEDLVVVLKEKFGNQAQFRLHANVRVLPKHVIADLSGFDAFQDYFSQAAKISKMLDAPAYTAHAGKRSECNIEKLFENTRRVQDMFGCPVGIEGHYPTKSNDYLINSWLEYQHLFNSGLSYALDLSHLNIIAAKSGTKEVSLIQEMLSSDQCLEVHLSENDGIGDTHQQIKAAPWWYECLPYVNESATIFQRAIRCDQLCLDREIELVKFLEFLNY